MGNSNNVTFGGPGGPTTISKVINDSGPHYKKTKKKEFKRRANEKVPLNARGVDWKELKKTAIL
ncbi:hypothetical protein KKG31_07020 [Patescibacteria group bacterium]|nr:hypothetical protein [Patescibacteria group bacterium]